MKRCLLLLCAVLLAGAVLLEGCGTRTAAVPAAAPEAAEAEPSPITAEDTPAPPTETESPAPTAAPVTPAPTPKPVLKKTGEKTQFYLLVKDGAGAEVLFPWLMGEGKDLLLAFSPETGEPVFLPAAGMGAAAGGVRAAEEKSRRVVLFADSFFIDSGALAEIVPAFEKKYGYEVEILTGSEDEAEELCRYADLAVLRSPAAQAILQKGIFATFWPYLVTEFSIERV